MAAQNTNDYQPMTTRGHLQISTAQGNTRNKSMHNTTNFRMPAIPNRLGTSGGNEFQTGYAKTRSKLLGSSHNSRGGNHQRHKTTISQGHHGDENESLLTYQPQKNNRGLSIATQSINNDLLITDRTFFTLRNSNVGAGGLKSKDKDTTELLLKTTNNMKALMARANKMVTSVDTIHQQIFDKQPVQLEIFEETRTYLKLNMREQHPPCQIKFTYPNQRFKQLKVYTSHAHKMPSEDKNQAVYYDPNVITVEGALVGGFKAFKEEWFYLTLITNNTTFVKVMPSFFQQPSRKKIFLDDKEKKKGKEADPNEFSFENFDLGIGNSRQKRVALNAYIKNLMEDEKSYQQFNDGIKRIKLRRQQKLNAQANSTLNTHRTIGQVTAQAQQQQNTSLQENSLTLPAEGSVWTSGSPRQQFSIESQMQSTISNDFIHRNTSILPYFKEYIAEKRILKAVMQKHQQVRVKHSRQQLEAEEHNKKIESLQKWDRYKQAVNRLRNIYTYFFMKRRLLKWFITMAHVYKVCKRAKENLILNEQQRRHKLLQRIISIKIQRKYRQIKADQGTRDQRYKNHVRNTLKFKSIIQAPVAEHKAAQVMYNFLKDYESCYSPALYIMYHGTRIKNIQLKFRQYVKVKSDREKVLCNLFKQQVKQIVGTKNIKKEVHMKLSEFAQSDNVKILFKKWLQLTQQEQVIRFIKFREKVKEFNLDKKQYLALKFKIHMERAKQESKIQFSAQKNGIIDLHGPQRDYKKLGEPVYYIYPLFNPDLQPKDREEAHRKYQENCQNSQLYIQRDNTVFETCTIENLANVAPLIQRFCPTPQIMEKIIWRSLQVTDFAQEFDIKEKLSYPESQGLLIYNEDKNKKEENKAQENEKNTPAEPAQDATFITTENVQ